jgi:putative DNA primase/helicase
MIADASKAPVNRQKMMLGPCRGRAVRLAEPDDVLIGCGRHRGRHAGHGHLAWAALSTSGLRSLDLPGDVRREQSSAATSPGSSPSAKTMTLHWMREGRRVHIAHPPQGMDSNDMLLGRAPRTKEGAQ